MCAEVCDMGCVIQWVGVCVCLQNDLVVTE